MKTDSLIEVLHVSYEVQQFNPLWCLTFNGGCPTNTKSPATLYRFWQGHHNHHNTIKECNGATLDRPILSLYYTMTPTNIVCLLL